VPELLRRRSGVLCRDIQSAGGLRHIGLLRWACD